MLDSPTSIATFASGGTTYAAVTALHDGVQILQLTGPGGALLPNPSPAGNLADTSSLLLGVPTSIATFASGGITHAAVASNIDDGVQIISLSDPYNPQAVSRLVDTDETLLDIAFYITTFASGGTTYAAVGADGDDGVQIVSLDRQSAFYGGDAVTLLGEASDPDGDALTYQWRQTSPPAPQVTVTNPASATTSFTAPPVDSDTDFVFSLAVSDGTDTADDSVTVTVLSNRPPTVDAGADQVVYEGDIVTLSGTATDTDGDTLTYRWSHDSDLFIHIAGDTQPSAAFTAPQVESDTTITFTLAVHDGTVSVSDAVSVRVRDNVPPTITILGDNPASIGVGSVYADAGATCRDPDTFSSLPVSTVSHVNTTKAGRYSVMYSCTDAGGQTGTNARIVIVGSPATPPNNDPNLYLVNLRSSVAAGDGTADFSSDARCIDSEDGDISHRITTQVTIDPDEGGLIVYWCTDYDDNTSTVRHQVAVVTPARPPQVTVTGGDLTVTVGSAYVERGAVCANDAGRQWAAEVEPHTSVDTANPGTYHVVYTCVDEDTGMAKGGLRIVRVVPVGTDTAPVLSVPEIPDIRVGDPFTPPGATCTDAEEGDISGSITIYWFDDLDTSKPGAYWFNYRCTDSAGNYDDRSVSVTVLDG